MKRALNTLAPLAPLAPLASLADHATQYAELIQDLENGMDMLERVNATTYHCSGRGFRRIWHEIEEKTGQADMLFRQYDQCHGKRYNRTFFPEMSKVLRKIVACLHNQDVKLLRELVEFVDVGILNAMVIGNLGKNGWDCRYLLEYAYDTTKSMEITMMLVKYGLKPRNPTILRREVIRGNMQHVPALARVTPLKMHQIATILLYIFRAFHAGVDITAAVESFAKFPFENLVFIEHGESYQHWFHHLRGYGRNQHVLFVEIRPNWTKCLRFIETLQSVQYMHTFHEFDRSPRQWVHIRLTNTLHHTIISRLRAIYILLLDHFYHDLARLIASYTFGLQFPHHILVTWT
jgi:hypothetical protein